VGQAFSQGRQRSLEQLHTVHIVRTRGFLHAVGTVNQDGNVVALAVNNVFLHTAAVTNNDVVAHATIRIATTVTINNQLIHIQRVWTGVVGRRTVASRVCRRHFGVNRVVLQQILYRYWDLEGQIIANSTGVFLATDSQSHGIAGLYILANRTGHINRTLAVTGLSVIQHTVSGDRVQRDLGFRQCGLHTVVAVSFSTSAVTGVVLGLDLGVDVVIQSQLGARNIHVPGLAIGINRGGVI